MLLTFGIPSGFTRRPQSRLALFLANWTFAAGETSLSQRHSHRSSCDDEEPSPPALIPLGPRELSPPLEPPDPTLVLTSSKARSTPPLRSLVSFPVLIDFPFAGQVFYSGMGLNPTSQSPTAKSYPSWTSAFSTPVEISSVGDGFITREFPGLHCLCIVFHFLPLSMDTEEIYV